METPATGMWGSPCDYPADFVTIDEIAERHWPRPSWSSDELTRRLACMAAILDLAEDLDARGLVLMSEVPTETMQDAGESYLHSEGWDASPYHAGKCFEVMAEVGALEFPPIPIKIDTADADLETGEGA